MSCEMLRDWNVNFTSTACPGILCMLLELEVHSALKFRYTGLWRNWNMIIHVASFIYMQP